MKSRLYVVWLLMLTSLTFGCAAEPQGSCGNGIVDPYELCEPRVFGSATCSAVSAEFSAGTVRCTDRCMLDFSECVRVPSKCGNGLVEGGEQCDDGNTDDLDRCANNCQRRINGELSLIEPKLIGAQPDAILNENYKCAKADYRKDYRSKPTTKTLYRIHLCQVEQDGKDVFKETDVRILLDSVRQFYRAAAIELVEEGFVRFTHKDCAPLYEDSSSFSKLISNNNPRGVIPITFVSRIPSTTSQFGIGGYATFGNISVNAGLSKTTLTHELGHFFGLAHTHACGYGRETIAMCRTSGDLICDTPPDHGPRGINGLDVCKDGTTLNGSCDDDGCGFGKCDDGALPDRDNVMSYYHCWPARLSSEQADFVRCTLDNELSSFSSPLVPVVTSVPSGVPGSLNSIWGSRLDDAWAVGDAAVILHWNGLTWSRMPGPSVGTDKNFHSVAGTGSDNVWVGTDRIFKWNGTSWSPAMLTTAGSVYRSLWFSGPQEVWLLGGSSVTKFDGINLKDWDISLPSEDGGITPDYGIMSIWGTSNNDITVVSLSNYVHRWNGSSWSQISVDLNEPSSMWGNKADDIWVAGLKGKLAHFTGAGWTNISCGTDSRLFSISGSGSNDVWAVGANGTVVHWDGKSCSLVDSGTMASLDAIWLASPSQAWAAGQNGTILQIKH